jgi:ABC-type transport system involved in cytochrome c biogenesis permease subunit
VSIAIGAAIHMLAIAARIYVLGRPPVSTLYESVIFVGLIVVMLSLLFEGRSRNGLGLIIGGSIGAILHFIGLNYADNGTTMQVLMPVLNTNFWLATHVLTISIGYGVCLFTGVLAHLYLLQKWRGKEASSLMRSSMAFGLIALLFTVTGTILGGIWADQSWGRFWGWDPKENGAMLICLWLILILHGRVAGILKPMAFIIGMAFLPCVVAVAWFGVNLLSVGLHSYGFTQGIALNLAAFIILETVIIAGLSSLIWQKNKQKKARNQQS